MLTVPVPLPSVGHVGDLNTGHFSQSAKWSVYKLHCVVTLFSWFKMI